MSKLQQISRLRRSLALAFGMAGALFAASPAAAQATGVDPDKEIDADLEKPGDQPVIAPLPVDAAVQKAPAAAPTASSPMPPPPPVSTPPAGTYKQDDLIGAAEGVFGKGAAGLADVIKDILSKQGEPNAYIVGPEGSAAIGIGLRYGSGTMNHKVAGQEPAYWTGPSIGLDAGANGGGAFGRV